MQWQQTLVEAQELVAHLVAGERSPGVLRCFSSSHWRQALAGLPRVRRAVRRSSNATQSWHSAHRLQQTDDIAHMAEARETRRTSEARNKDLSSALALNAVLTSKLKTAESAAAEGDKTMHQLRLSVTALSQQVRQSIALSSTAARVGDTLMQRHTQSRMAP